MSFASDVKNEICKIELTDICCMRARLAGIVCFGATVKPQSLRLKTENAMVAQQIYQLIKKLYNIEINVTFSQGGTFLAELIGDDVIKIMRDMRLATVPIRIDKNIIRNGCCKIAFVQGAFLGGGSVSAPSKAYHTEIVTSHYALCKDFTAILDHFDINAKNINRNGNYVFYIKDSEQIEDLLAVLGAHSKLMDFLNIKIEKEVRNTTNRLVNCETANVEKTVNASFMQKNAIKKIYREIGFENLSPELYELAKLRIENPDSSLMELSKMLGISKSGVNHRMRRLLALVEEEK